MRLASRMNRLGTETTFEVLARTRSLEQPGRTIIHLEIGEPDFDTPQTSSAWPCARSSGNRPTLEVGGRLTAACPAVIM
jgi:aspartate/methionine/tyrosine aminotransferase